MSVDLQNVLSTIMIFHIVLLLIKELRIIATDMQQWAHNHVIHWPWHISHHSDLLDRKREWTFENTYSAKFQYMRSFLPQSRNQGVEKGKVPLTITPSNPLEYLLLSVSHVHKFYWLRSLGRTPIRIHKKHSIELKAKISPWSLWASNALKPKDKKKSKVIEG